MVRLIGLAATTILVTAGVAHADAYIRLAANTGKCIHKGYSHFNNGNPVKLWDCNGNATNSAFIYEEETGYLRFKENPSACLHKMYSHFNNGNRLHVYACAAGGPDNKTFTYNPINGQLHFRQRPSKCVHVQSSNHNNGTPIHLWDCNGNNNSRWVIDESAPPETDWSDWYDRDDPSGTGDGEQMASAWAEGLISCGNPVAMQARRVSDGLPARLTGEVLTMNTTAGLVCRNNEQPDGQCDDYEVRMACPTQELGSNADTGTVRSTLQTEIWSDWFNRDGPSGTGDGERIPEAYAEGRIPCADPSDIQARRRSDGLFAQFTGENFTLDTTTGFVCLNADQPDGSCADYEIRVACPVWSAWVSRDENGRTGDFEGIASHFEEQNFACDTADRFEARRISDGVDAASTGEIVTYDTDYGFACVNADQPDNQCDDYEVRMRCTVDLDGIETHRRGGVRSDFAKINLSGAAMDGVWFAQVTGSPMGASPRMDASGRVMIEGTAPIGGVGVDVTAIVGSLGGVAEIGQAVVDSGNTTINLSARYVSPLVFTQVVSRNQSDAVVALGTVSGGQFAGNTLTLRLAERAGANGAHGDEVVHYLVIEQGIHQTADGRTIIAGFTGASYAYVDTETSTLVPLDVGTQATVVTQPQDVQRWHATAADLRFDADGLLDALQVTYLGDFFASSNRMGYLIVGGGPDVVEFDSGVTSQCGGGGNGNDYVIADRETYGNRTVSATYDFKSGIERNQGEMWAGLRLDLEANLFGNKATLFALEASTSEDNGSFDSRMYANALGVTYIDEPVGLTFEWSRTQQLLYAQGMFYGVTIEGELLGTIGLEASVAIAGGGVTLGAMPFGDVTAAASASIGGLCVSAGIGADLSVVALEVPLEATIATTGNDIAWSIDSAVEMEALSGAITLKVEYCVDSEEYKLFKWKGIDLPTINLANAAGCF